MGGYHKWLDRIASPDFDGHDTFEATSDVILHYLNRTSNQSAIDEALLGDEGSAHVRYHSNHIVVAKRVRIN